MKQVQVFEEGDKVLVKGTIEAIKVEGGIFKYQIRDIKSSSKINTWFTGEEILPLEEGKG